MCIDDKTKQAIANISPLKCLSSSPRYGQTDLVKALLLKGADLIGEDEQGRSPLHNAVEQGHEKTAMILVEVLYP